MGEWWLHTSIVNEDIEHLWRSNKNYSFHSWLNSPTLTFFAPNPLLLRPKTLLLDHFQNQIWFHSNFCFFDPSPTSLPRIEGLILMTHGISLVTGLVVVTCRFSLDTKALKLQTLTREVFYCKLIKTITIISMMVV